MADWVYTEMIVTGDENEIVRFIEDSRCPHPVQDGEGRWRMQSDEEASELSFWSAVAPDDLTAYFSSPGTSLPYDNPNAARPWNIENWGTKWDAREVETDVNDRLDGTVAYLFSTPYSAPFGYLDAVVAKWPSLRFQVSWSDEEGYGAELDGEGGELREVEEW